MKISIKITVIIFAISCLFFSCKKSSKKDATPAAPAMEFMLNGASKTFNTSISYTSAIAGGFETHILGGNNITAVSAGTEELTITILHTEAFQVGVVYFVKAVPSNPNGVFFSYNPDGGNNAYITQPANPWGAITITEIGTTYIKGTISLTELFNPTDTNGENTLYTLKFGQFTANIVQAP